MKLLAFTPFGCSSGHHEVDAEVVADYQSQGHVVHALQCNGELLTCDANPTHDFLDCLGCHSISTNTLDAVNIPQENRHQLELSFPLAVHQIPTFKNISEVREFKWNGLPAGLAVASSTITALCRDTEPDVLKYRDFIVKGLMSFAAVHQSVTQLIQETRPDLFYVFNGRSVIYNAAFMAARGSGIQCIVGERDNFQEYILLENANGVDLNFIKSSIQRWKKSFSSDTEAEALSRSWFERTRSGNKEILCNYLREQTVGSLPDGFDRRKRNIVIFGSSEDEIVVAPGWDNLFFANQTDGIQYLLDHCQDPSIHFYLRAHPNLTGLDCAQNRQLASLRGRNFSLIAPESSVDSYALLEASEKVITFGSTIGIEATYWRKPSILVGRSFYEDLDACYRPLSPSELMQMVVAELTPKPQGNALQYAYWWKRRGIKLRHVVPNNPVTGAIGTIKGSPMVAKRWICELKKWRFVLKSRWKSLMALPHLRRSIQ